MGEIYSKADENESGNGTPGGESSQLPHSYGNVSHNAENSAPAIAQTSSRTTPGRSVGQSPHSNAPGTTPNGQVNGNEYAMRFHSQRNTSTSVSQDPPRREVASSGGPHHAQLSHQQLPSASPSEFSQNTSSTRSVHHMPLLGGYGSNMPHLRRPQLINEHSQLQPISQALSHSPMQQQQPTQGKRPRLASGTNEGDDPPHSSSHHANLSLAHMAPGHDVGLAGRGSDQQSLHRPPASLSPKTSSSAYQAAGYHPQVEAISPAPEDVRMDSNLMREKESISTKLMQVDKEIAHHEESKRRLIQKQVQLMERISRRQAAHHESGPGGSNAGRANTGPVVNGSSEDASCHGLEEVDDLLLKPKSFSNPIHEVLSENRQKAKEQHESMLRLCSFLPTAHCGGAAPPIYHHNGISPMDAPLYRQPCDLEAIKEEIRYYKEEFKPRLMLYIHKRRFAERARLKLLSRQYDAQSKVWCKKVDKVNNSTKRRQKEARMRELFERTFPEVKKNREDREKAILAAEELTAAAASSGGSAAVSVSIPTSSYSSTACSSTLIPSHANEERYTTRGAINNYQNTNNSAGSGDDEIIPYDPIKERQRLRDQAIEPPITMPPWDRKYQFVYTNGLVRDPKAQHRQDQDTVSYWSPIEDAIFRTCYTQFTKNFQQYTQFLPRKRVQDLVQYYYLTKTRAQYKNLAKKHNRRRGRGGLPVNIPCANVTNVAAYRVGVAVGNTHGRFAAIAGGTVVSGVETNGETDQGTTGGDGEIINTSTTATNNTLSNVSANKKPPEEEEEEEEVVRVKPITPLNIFNPLHEEVSSAEEDDMSMRLGGGDDEDDGRKTSSSGVVTFSARKFISAAVEHALASSSDADLSAAAGAGAVATSADGTVRRRGSTGGINVNDDTGDQGESACIKDIIHMVIDRTLHTSWKDGTPAEKAAADRASGTNVPASQQQERTGGGPPPRSSTASANATLAPPPIDIVRALTPPSSSQVPLGAGMASPVALRGAGVVTLGGRYPAPANMSVSPGSGLPPPNMPKTSPGQAHPMMHPQMSTSLMSPPLVGSAAAAAAAHYYRNQPSFLQAHHQALQQHLAGNVSTGDAAATAAALNMLSGHHLAMRHPSFPDSQTAIVYPHGLSAVPMPSFLPGAPTLQRASMARMSAPYLLPPPPGSALSSYPPPPPQQQQLPHGGPILNMTASTGGGNAPGMSAANTATTSSSNLEQRPSSSSTAHQPENSNKAILDCDFLTAQEIVSPVMPISTSTAIPMGFTTSPMPGGGGGGGGMRTATPTNKMSLSKPPGLLGSREEQRPHPSAPIWTPPMSALSASVSSSSAATKPVVPSLPAGPSASRMSSAINPSDLPLLKNNRPQQQQQPPQVPVPLTMPPRATSPLERRGSDDELDVVTCTTEVETAVALGPRDASPPVHPHPSQHDASSSAALQRLYTEHMSMMPFRARSDSQRTRTSSEASQCVKEVEHMRRKLSQLHEEQELVEQQHSQFQHQHQTGELGGKKDLKEDMPPPLGNFSHGRFRVAGAGNGGVSAAAGSSLEAPSASTASVADDVVEPPPPRRHGIALSGPEAFRKRGYTDSGLNLRSPAAAAAATSSAAVMAESGLGPSSSTSSTSSAGSTTSPRAEMAKLPRMISTAAALVMAAAATDKSATAAGLDHLHLPTSAVTTTSIIDAMIERQIVDDLECSSLGSPGDAALTRDVITPPTVSPSLHQLKVGVAASSGMKRPVSPPSPHLTIGYQIEKYIEQETNRSPVRSHSPEPSTSISPPHTWHRVVETFVPETLPHVERPQEPMEVAPSSTRKECPTPSPSPPSSPMPPGIRQPPQSPPPHSPPLPSSPCPVEPTAPSSMEVTSSTSSPIAPLPGVSSPSTTLWESHVPLKKRALLPPPPLPSPAALSSGGSSPFREGDLQIDIGSAASQDEEETAAAGRLQCDSPASLG